MPWPRMPWLRVPHRTESSPNRPFGSGALLDLGGIDLARGVRLIGEAKQAWTPDVPVNNYREALAHLDWRWRFKQAVEHFGLSAPKSDSDLGEIQRRIAAPTETARAFSLARVSADVTEPRFPSVSAQGTQTPAIPPGIWHSRRAAARTRAMPVSSRNRFIVTPASCQPRNWSTW